MKYTLVLDIDPEDGVVSAWSSDSSQGLLTTMADTIEEALANIRMLIDDCIEHNWRDLPEWQGITSADVEFEFEYSLVSFFDVYKALKISEIARMAKLNPALVRAYANGDKNPSLAQIEKIQEAVHRLAQSLLSMRVVPKIERPLAA